MSFYKQGNMQQINDLEPGRLFDLRVNKGLLPTIDIAGHTFYVDLHMNKLRPKDDFRSNGIGFDEIREYYDRERRAYVIPYNPTTHEFQQDDVFKMTQLPKDTIIVQFPHQHELDIVGWNRKHGITSSKREVARMHFEARTLPWKDTNLIEHIKRNVAEQLLPKEKFTVDQPRDSLYRIPTDEDRVLPTHEIHGTEFIVDVNQLELREKANPKNAISLSDMEENAAQGYRFWFNPSTKSLARYSEGEARYTEIPDFVKLDSVGMAKKHGIPEDKMAGMDDFKLMVDQDAFERIAHRGITPTIDIAGQTFYIDLPNDRLHPKDDIWSRGILFSELEYYYSHKDDVYTIPYNQRTHAFQEVSLDVKAIPESLVVVQLPGKRALDPIGQNRTGNLNDSDFLKKKGVCLHFKARVIPWRQTRFAETVKRNNAQEAKAEQKPKPQEGKRKGRGL